MITPSLSTHQLSPAALEGPASRAYFVDLLRRLARPVLVTGARRELRASLPVAPGHEDAARFGPAEAVGRTLAGIAPWLEHDHGDPAERALRTELRALAPAAILAFVDPASPDHVGHEHGHTHIEAAYLAQAFLHAPNALWNVLAPADQARVADWMRAAGRRHATVFNNHLLFHALSETALARLTGDWDRLRIDYALRQHEQWYAGDGWYLDGPEFHLDYYNSFVIHPMMLEVAHHLAPEPTWQPHEFFSRFLRRAQRHAVCLERLVSPEAAVPLFGRSIPYRSAVFTLPAYLALRGWLPEGLSPGRVRSFMTAATHRIMESQGVFDPQGWLTIGFCGQQDSLGESYLAISSLYLACNVLLPLGLPPEHAFWSARAEDWTARRAYAGQQIPRDASLSGDMLAPHQIQWGVR